MPVLFRTIAIAALAAALLMPEGAAFAGLGQPTPWQLGLQDSGSPVMDDVIWLHTFVLWIITAITVFVLALLVIATNPYALLFLLPSLHAWLWLLQAQRSPAPVCV